MYAACVVAPVATVLLLAKMGCGGQQQQQLVAMRCDVDICYLQGCYYYYYVNMCTSGFCGGSGGAL